MRALHEKARRLGYIAAACDLCRGSGVSRRPDMNSPNGVKVADPCDGCGGSGRWWLPDAARSGVIIPPKTDLEFARL